MKMTISAEEETRAREGCVLNKEHFIGFLNVTHCIGIGMKEPFLEQLKEKGISLSDFERSRL